MHAHLERVVPLPCSSIDRHIMLLHITVATDQVTYHSTDHESGFGQRSHGLGGGGAAQWRVGAVVVAAGDADVVGVAAAAPEPGVRALQVGDPRRAAQLPRVPAVVRARPLLPRRAGRLVRGLPRARARRPGRRLALAPRRRRAVPGLRFRHQVQPRGAAAGVGARHHLVPHARRLLPRLRRAPAAAVPRRGAPRRHLLRPPRLRAGAGPRVPPPGRSAPPLPLRRGRAQGRLLLLHRARRVAGAAPARRAVARGGTVGHGGVVGVSHGGVPAGVRAVPPHVRAPDPALRGDLPHVRRRGARRRRRDLRGAPSHPDAAARHQPPLQGLHHLLPRHHHRQPARRPPRCPLLQGRQELLQLRRPPGWLVGAAERVLYVPVRRGEDHAQSPKNRVHREPVAYEHGVRAPQRQAGTVTGGQRHVGGERHRRVPPRLRAVDGRGVRVQEQTSSRDVPVPQQRRDHAVRLHARQGAPPHHLRLRDDPRAVDPEQSCGSLLSH